MVHTIWNLKPVSAATITFISLLIKEKIDVFDVNGSLY
jgi:hypothetical protein